MIEHHPLKLSEISGCRQSTESCQITHTDNDRSGLCFQAERLTACSPMQDLFLEAGKYMRDNILKDFPPEFRATTKQSNVSESYDMMTRPNLDKHVFLRVLEDRGAVELDAEG